MEIREEELEARDVGFKDEEGRGERREEGGGKAVGRSKGLEERGVMEVKAVDPEGVGKGRGTKEGGKERGLEIVEEIGPRGVQGERVGGEDPAEGRHRGSKGKRRGP